ncbi:MAG: ComEA family DNA-binding protein [Nitrosomonas sp.]|nr:MAG: ComEA family DNA-binding protein [Nitrosomonas sp.]
MKNILFIMMLTFLFTGSTFAAVNLNTATQAELEALQGIGPAKAKAIVEYREKNGSFASVDDLEKVAGIGSATIKQLRDEIVVEVEQTKEVPAKQE